MRAIITVEMDGAAFEDPPHELARILKHAALNAELAIARGRQDDEALPLRDSSGNTVGSFRVED